MKFIRTLITLIMPLLLIALAAGAVSATTETPALPATLDNVRAYAAAPQAGGLSYANAGGILIAGSENVWHTVNFPQTAIASGIAIDSKQPQTLYVGVANETSLMRTTDGGETWLRIPLSTDYDGAVTTVAVDSAQRIVYAGTDHGSLYRLHDVGSSMILAGKQNFSEPIEQLAVDATGSQLAFVRTTTQLYQAVDNGLNWESVKLLSMPTALAIANTTPATVYVGTMDKGVLKTNDGVLWLRANEGFEMGPGVRLKVDALTVDPAEPNRLYVAASYLFGNTEVHQSPVGIAMSQDSAASWQMINNVTEIAATELLPVSGKVAGVYALFSNSRTPFALGEAQPLVAIDTSTGGPSWSQIFATGALWQWLLALTVVIAMGVALAIRQSSRAHSLLTSIATFRRR